MGVFKQIRKPLGVRAFGIAPPQDGWEPDF
jgi:hypothetical protein